MRTEEEISEKLDELKRKAHLARRMTFYDQAVLMSVWAEAIEWVLEDGEEGSSDE